MRRFSPLVGQHRMRNLARTSLGCCRQKISILSDWRLRIHLDGITLIELKASPALGQMHFGVVQEAELLALQVSERLINFIFG